MRIRSPLTHAFTLIELLVVVAILAVLIAVLLPALARAREQSRVTVCLANMHTLATAQSAYLSDFDDLPWVMPWAFSAGGQTYDFVAYTPYVWGGALPGKTVDEWNAAGMLPFDARDMFLPDFAAIPPRYRPLNRYISPHVSWDRERFDDAEHPPQTPGFFRCPSDNSVDLAFVWGQRCLDDSGAYAAADFLGTSYGINWYWPNYYLETPLAERYSKFGDGVWLAMLGGHPQGRGIGREMLRSRVERWQAEFVSFMENRFVVASAAARPRGATNDNALRIPGWHGQEDYHTALFLDGHAQNRRFDTRYVDGPGWTVWPARPWQGAWSQYEDR